MQPGQNQIAPAPASSTPSSGSGITASVMPSASSMGSPYSGFGGFNGQSMQNMAFQNPWQPPQQPFQPQPSFSAQVMPAANGNTGITGAGVPQASQFRPVTASRMPYYMDQFNMQQGQDFQAPTWSPSPFVPMGNNPQGSALVNAFQMPRQFGQNPILQQRDMQRQQDWQRELQRQWDVYNAQQARIKAREDAARNPHPWEEQTRLGQATN